MPSRFGICLRKRTPLAPGLSWFTANTCAKASAMFSNEVHYLDLKWTWSETSHSSHSETQWTLWVLWVWGPALWTAMYDTTAVASPEPSEPPVVGASTPGEERMARRSCRRLKCTVPRAQCGTTTFCSSNTETLDWRGTFWWFHLPFHLAQDIANAVRLQLQPKKCNPPENRKTQQTNT